MGMNKDLVRIIPAQTVERAVAGKNVQRLTCMRRREGTHNLAKATERRIVLRLL